MKFVQNKNLLFSLKGSFVKITLPYESLEILAAQEIREYIVFFKKERTKASFLKAFHVDVDIFDFLLENNIIFPSQSAEVFSKGICLESRTSGFDFTPLSKLHEGRYRAAILGIPIDFTQNKKYTSWNGASKIREALMLKIGTSQDKQRVIVDSDFNLMSGLKDLRTCDVGNITYYPNYDGIESISKKVEYAIHKIMDSGAVPYILGGDHAISYFSIAGISKKIENMGVIQIDAHSDLYISPNLFNDNLAHSNVFDKISRLETIREIIQLGVRTLSATPQGLELTVNEKVKQVSSYQLMTSRVEDLKIFDKKRPYYLSIDLDVLDPSLISTEVDTPVLGGVNYYKLIELIKFITRNVTIVGVDFVEVAEGERSYNFAAQASARILLNILMEKANGQPAIYNAYKIKNG